MAKGYIRSVIKTWDSLEVKVDGWQQPIKLTDSEDFTCIGFLEVYGSMEDFKALYPNEEPLIMEINYNG